MRSRMHLGLTVDKRRLRAYLEGMAKKLAAPDRPRAIGYVRVSSAKQAAEGGSLEAQRDAIIRAAVLSGLDLLDVFADAGISGGKDETKRPGLAAALEAIESGRASVLIVKHSDRLSRDSDLAGFLAVQVKRAGGRLEIIDEAKNDPIRTAVDKMLAELERIRGSQRMKTFHATRKAKGLPAGPAPFGFTVGEDGKLVPLASEYPTVERVRSLRAAGSSLRQIVATLNADDILSPTGKSWNPATVAKILSR